LNPYSNTRLPPKVAPTVTSPAITNDSTNTGVGVDLAVLYWGSRRARSIRVSTVTVIMIHACVLTVRRAWVPFSVDWSQSQ